MVGALGALLVAIVVEERPTTDYLLTIALVAFAAATSPPRGYRTFWAIAMVPSLVLLIVSFYVPDPWSAILAGTAILYYLAWFARGIWLRRRRRK
jgi:hypothetical protein